MKEAVVLMTALVPTVGHLALIRFAAHLVGPGGYVDVIVSGRSFEPVPLKDRVYALDYDTRTMARETGTNIWITPHDDDNAPQNPSTDEEWNYWKDVCQKESKLHSYLVASEPYGKKMAEVLGCEFVPFDIDRELVPVKGSDVRKNLQEDFKYVIPAMQKILRQKVTIFGTESIGKSTVANSLSSWYGVPYTKEFARMTIHDTDLLSTIGYYRIFGSNAEGTNIEKLFQLTKSDLYIVLDTNIPFEADPLRYGGDVRESDTQFWIDLLDEYNCNYYVVRSAGRYERLVEIESVVDDHVWNKFEPIMDFVRD